MVHHFCSYTQKKYQVAQHTLTSFSFGKIHLLFTSSVIQLIDYKHGYRKYFPETHRITSLSELILCYNLIPVSSLQKSCEPHQYRIYTGRGSHIDESPISIPPFCFNHFLQSQNRPAPEKSCHIFLLSQNLLFMMPQIQIHQKTGRIQYKPDRVLMHIHHLLHWSMGNISQTLSSVPGKPETQGHSCAKFKNSHPITSFRPVINQSSICRTTKAATDNTWNSPIFLTSFRLLTVFYNHFRSSPLQKSCEPDSLICRPGRPPQCNHFHFPFRFKAGHQSRSKCSKTSWTTPRRNTTSPSILSPSFHNYLHSTVTSSLHRFRNPAKMEIKKRPYRGGSPAFPPENSPFSVKNEWKNLGKTDKIW